ncbi:MAG: thioredoxin domain-containing protein [Actinobacteria bacterium]|nr:thioredoxin domain-containing protein [Actinomycetota bacterium]
MLFHLCMLGLPAAVFLAVSGEPSPSSASGSYATTVSAFRVHSRRVLPPMGDPTVRRQIEAIFTGIPQHREALGNPRAPVTMQFLADPECPEARQFTIQLLPLLVRRWVRDGRLRIEYLDQQNETIWPYTFRIQQFAVLAAGGQGKLWQYLEAFYRYQGPEGTRYADDRFFNRLAREVPGLDRRTWMRERRTGSWLHAAAVRDLKVGVANRIAYTPAFLIGPTGGKLKPLLDFTLTEPLAFEAAFEKALGSLSRAAPSGG